MEQPRAYRYRCYSTPAQADVLARTFGCARYVYNWVLHVRTEAYHERQEHLDYQVTSAALTTLKQQPETAWLSEVSSVQLQQALRHLDTACRRFFAHRARYPRQFSLVVDAIRLRKASRIASLTLATPYLSRVFTNAAWPSSSSQIVVHSLTVMYNASPYIEASRSLTSG